MYYSSFCTTNTCARRLVNFSEMCVVYNSTLQGTCIFSYSQKASEVGLTACSFYRDVSARTQSIILHYVILLVRKLS